MISEDQLVEYEATAKAHGGLEHLYQAIIALATEVRRLQQDNAKLARLIPGLVADLRHLRAEQMFIQSIMTQVDTGDLRAEEFYDRLIAATPQEIDQWYLAIRAKVGK